MHKVASPLAARSYDHGEGRNLKAAWMPGCRCYYRNGGYRAPER